MNDNIIYLVVAIFAVALGIIIRALNKFKQDLSDMKLSLDKVTKQIGVVDIPIKMYRIATGKDLEEAKDYINNLK